jgi:hypothetical protein
MWRARGIEMWRARGIEMELDRRMGRVLCLSVTRQDGQKAFRAGRRNAGESGQIVAVCARFNARLECIGTG